MATRKDVAQLAGVSSTSVSYYINKTGYVSKEHGEKIQLAIDMLGYRPNLVAKSLKTKNSKQLVFLCNQVKNPFHADFISHITELAYQKGYMMLFSNVLTEKEYIDRICSYQVDGVFIVSDNILPKDINRICSHGVNVVLINNMTWTDIDERVSRISIDLSDSIKNLVHKALKKEHKNCLCITSLEFPSERINEKKIIAFSEALQEQLLPITEDNFLMHVNSEADVHKKLPEIIQSSNPPDAYVCSNDSIALSVLALLNHHGVKVPEEASVIGCDNISSAQYSFPKLSTIEINTQELAIKAMDIMTQKIEGHTPDDSVIFSRVIERESV